MDSNKIQPLRLRQSGSIPTQTCYYQQIIIQNASTMYSLVQTKPCHCLDIASDLITFYLQRFDNSTDIPYWKNIFQIQTMSNSLHYYLDSHLPNETNLMNLFNYKQCQLLFPVLFPQTSSTSFLNNNDYPMGSYSRLTCIVDSNISNKERLYIFKRFCVQTYYSRYIDDDINSILMAIDLQNDVVTGVLNLNDLLKKFLLNNFMDDIDTTKMVIWDMKNKGNQCHMLIQFYNQSKPTIYHITHNIDSDKFELLGEYPQPQRIDCRIIMISTGSILFVSEKASVQKNIQFRWYDEKGNKWLSIGNNIQFKMHRMNLDCCVFVKGNYGVIFTSISDNDDITSHGIFIVDLNQNRLIHAAKQCHLCGYWDYEGPYKAILQSAKAQDIETMMGGFIRDIIRLDNNMRFPPHYLIKLLTKYYSKEKIYLIKKVDMEDFVWILNVDDLFS